MSPNTRRIVRPAAERGHFDFGWLDTFHSFSFGDYADSRWMGFSDLRVINEDRLEPGGKFGMHGHRDMEILTWVLEGAIEHQDSLGNGEVLRPGEIQRMTAGSGIRHSEANPSDAERLHLLQIWLLPAARSTQPSYEQKAVDPESMVNKFAKVAAPPGEEGVVSIGQDASLYVARIEAGQNVALSWKSDRAAWIQIAKGSVRVDDLVLEQGDGLAVSVPGTLSFEALEPAEVLAFDLRAAT